MDIKTQQAQPHSHGQIYDLQNLTCLLHLENVFGEGKKKSNIFAIHFVSKINLTVLSGNPGTSTDRWYQNLLTQPLVLD